MIDASTITVHGRRAAYRRAGDNQGRPCIVLVHGIAGDSSEWAPVLDKLAEQYDVLAPDLAGHGESTRLHGDHSIGAFATWLRDLLEALEIERATFVGHSLGGGVVMQFAYQFPEYVERMILVSSGGLGRTEGDRRAAFVRVVRAIASPGGQRVNASDRLYLAEDVPTLIMWGERDRVIPAHHGRATHEAVPGSRIVMFEKSGHFPHADEPDRFTAVIKDFVNTTEPAAYDRARARLRMTSR